jgi:hypothetical protein
MIFNKAANTVTAIDEFRAHVAILDKKTDFELLGPDIENAEYEVRRIVGSAVYDRAETEYKNGTDELNNELVKRVQSAIANIAFRDYTVNNDLRHSTTGRKAAVNPANEKQAWEFFIERDNEALNFKIQKSLNRLIDYLERGKIEEWTNSAVFKMKHRVLLSDIEMFTRYYPIDNSLALFNQLLPIQMEMQRKYIAPILGKELLENMLSVNPDESGAGADDELLRLIDYAGPALSLWTMATGIKRLSIKLLPEGLVQQFKSSVQSRNSSFPVAGKEKDLIIAALTRDAEEATTMLENQIKIITAEKTDTVVVPVTMVGERNVSSNKYFAI